MKTLIILGLCLGAAYLAYGKLGIKDVFGKKNEIAAIPNGITGNAGFYDFKVKTLMGKDSVDFSSYKGKKIVLINVASKCGFTPQYADWEAFNKAHGDKIVVLGFPANNFMHQESGTNDEIAEFCQKNYGVSFQMFEKISVKGKDQHPLYTWLSTKNLNGWNDKEPSWNFCKYVIDENGKLTHFFGSKITPSDAEFKAAVGI